MNSKTYRLKIPFNLEKIYDFTEISFIYKACKEGKIPKLLTQEFGYYHESVNRESIYNGHIPTIDDMNVSAIHFRAWIVNEIQILFPRSAD